MAVLGRDFASDVEREDDEAWRVCDALVRGREQGVKLFVIADRGRV